SILSNQFGLLVGYFGMANLLVVSNGGLVINTEGTLGVNVSSSNNLAIVTGSGSLWSNAAALYVGSRGASNQLLLNNSATIVATVGSIGNDTNANRNSANLTDPGS